MSRKGAQAHDAAARRMLALSVALDHPALNTDAIILCSVARVCKALRQAVQQCNACNTAVVIGPTFASHHEQTAPLVKLSSFARWLPAHAALVKSITTSTAALYRASSIHGASNTTMPLNNFVDIAQQLMQPAMALAAAGVAAQPAAPTARNTPLQQQQQQQQQQRGLRLVSFTGDLPGMPGMLAALPAHSLTHLNLDLWACTAISGPGLAAALARLSSLQHLNLTKSKRTPAFIPTSCLEGIAQLTRLTYLGLGGPWSGEQQPLQRLLAQPPPLQQLKLQLDSRLAVLGLAQCTQLRQLSVKTFGSLPRDSTLPRQLQQLDLDVYSRGGDALAALQLEQLQDLQELRLFAPMTASSLQGITQLPCLQLVALGYRDVQSARRAAPLWEQVPQLRELTVLTGGAPEQDSMSAILKGIGACSGLTKLHIEVSAARVQHEGDFSEYEDSEDEEAAMRAARLPACGILARLTTLQDLSFDESSSLMDGDALQLTALASLTRLVLGGLGAGVGELAANALACSLKQLRHLDLQSCNLGSMSCLAAIAHLQQLTELRLEGNRGLTQQGLMLLTRLSNLQQLGADAGQSITSAAWADFWAAVRGQRRVL